MKTKSELKTELKELVSKKVQNTQERLALKRIPFPERSSMQHSTMLWHWGEGSMLKERIRSLGLAYAFIRGRRYWETERFTKEAPYARNIALDAGVEEAAVQAWLKEKPSQEELVAYEQHLQSAKEKVRATRAARPSRRSAA